MKAIKILVILAVVVLAILAGGLWYVNHYIQRPEFKAKMLAVARKALHTDVQVKELRVSIFSGAELEGVAIANPSGFTGDLLTAKAFRLRYRLWPLLHKRVEIATLSLEQPTITLARNEKKEWNYERLSGEKAAPSPTPQPAGDAKSVGGLDVSIEKVALQDAVVVMRDETGKELLKVAGVDFLSAVNLSGTQISGSGQLKIGLVNVANSLAVRSLASPVVLEGSGAKLAPLSGKLAGGDVSGDVVLRFDTGDLFAVNLQVKGAEVKTLLQEAGVNKVVLGGGKMSMTATLAGKGGLETIVGKGEAEVVNGVLLQMPLQELLAALLQVPELREIKFDECRLVFSISNNVMQTPVIKLSSPLVRVSGTGSVSLADYSLNHELTLMLAKDVLARAPKEIVSQFEQQADGFYALSFKVWGPYDAPKTDLGKKLLQGGVKQLLNKFLRQ